tara:strand:- start:114 stop:1010 length:897 start_codon:yes stop_codon:yes gene_type:complete
VYSGNKYRIYTTSAITFDQTFAEDAYSVKTLHDQSKMFEGSSITKANPASFSFDIPLTTEKDESIMVDLACDLVATSEADIETQQLKSFDIYVQTGSSTFKLEGAVITGATFDFVPTNQFQMRLEGQGKKLTRAGDESFSIPGSAQSESATRNPLIVYPVIEIDSLNMSSIISCNLQLQNNITWTPYETLNDSLEVTDSSNAMFPTTYTLGKRIISGEIRQYQTDNNVTQFDDFNTDSTLIIKAIEVGKASNATAFFQLTINPCMYTARVQPGEVYSQSYDFRSLDNSALSSIITQYS